MPEDFIDENTVAAAWDRNADQWSRDVQAGFDVYRTLYTLPAYLSFLPDITGKSVIDLGCGEGSNTRLFAELGGKLTGIDLSQRLLEEARRKEALAPLGIQYVNASFTHMSMFPDESFDAALSTMALMDGPDLPVAMQEAHRVLKPGSVISFSVLHPCFITPATKWARDEEGQLLGLRVGRYFERKPLVEHWRFRKGPSATSTEEAVPFEVPHFPRTLSDYINAVSDAGFRITKIEEPRPDTKLSEENPWLARWHAHAPLVLFVEAAKQQ